MNVLQIFGKAGPWTNGMTSVDSTKGWEGERVVNEDVLPGVEPEHNITGME